MYVAHTGADRVDVLDCERRAFLRSLPDLPGVAGVLIDEQARSALHQRPRRRAGERLPLLGRDAARPGRGRSAPERARLRPRTGGACTRSTSASRSARAAPPRSSSSTSTAGDRRAAAARAPALGGLRPGARPRLREHPRARADRRHRLRPRRRSSARSTCRAAGPHGLWLDRGRLFCAADGGALVVLDRDSGEVLATPARCRASPTSSCTTPTLRRLYVAIGDPGVVCSFDSERLEPLEDGRDRARSAHDRLGSGRPLASTSSVPSSGGAAVYEERA